VLDSPIQNGSSVLSVRFSPDGQTLATASFDSRARIWNLQGQQLAEYQSETGLWNASFSPDGKQLAAVGWGNQGWLWSVYDLDQLLNQGCDWMQDYLTTHPDAAKDLTVCHD
jgi:WD40 repeat protein